MGDDALSRGWLAENRERLQRAGASGLVVNVASLQTFRALRALAPDLPMAPGSLDGLAPRLGSAVYPLYVPVRGPLSQRVPQPASPSVP